MLKRISAFRNRFLGMSIQAKASIAFMICSFMQRGISVLTTPIFTRLLTTEQYGYYSIFNSWLNIVSVFTTLNLAGGVFSQALVKFDERRDEITTSSAGLGSTLSILVAIIYFPFRKLLNPLMGVSTLVMYCIILASWATLIFDLWAAKERVAYRYKALVALTLIIAIAKPLFGVIAILLTDVYKAEARIVSLVAVEVVTYSWILVSFLKKDQRLFNKEFWNYSLRLNLPLIPHYLTRTVLNQCDRLMINYISGYANAGIYSLAYNLAWMLNIVTNAILSSFNPWMYERIKKKDYKAIGKQSYSLLIIVAIMGLGLISIAPEIIWVFAPVEYRTAIWVIPPVTASVYFLFMYSLFANFEFYYEKTQLLAFASVFGGILNIVLNLIFIKRYGFLAAGYTTLVCFLFYAVAHYMCMNYILKKECSGVKVYDLFTIIVISLCFLGFSAVMMVTYNHNIIRYCIILVTFIILVIKRNTLTIVFKNMRNR